MTQITTKGFAVFEGGKINVFTIGTCRNAAQVNWLCVNGFMALQRHTDEEIEGFWQKSKGTAEIIEVTITGEAP